MALGLILIPAGLLLIAFSGVIARWQSHSRAAAVLWWLPRGSTASVRGNQVCDVVVGLAAVAVGVAATIQG